MAILLKTIYKVYKLYGKAIKNVLQELLLHFCGKIINYETMNK